MNFFQKKLFSGLLFIVAVMVLGACTEADPIVPTEYIVIKNIPRKIYQSFNPDAKDDEENIITFPYDTDYLIAPELKKDVFKVYFQLSDGTDEFASNPAEGELDIGTAASEGLLTLTGDTFTIKIPLVVPLTKAMNDEGITTHERVSTAKWSSIALIICPEPVDTIFDIDAKVDMKGPTSAPDVEFDWNTMLNKDYMTIKVGPAKGLINYKQLYGKKDYKVDFGVVVREEPYQTLPFPSGARTPAGEEIFTFDQFVNRN